MTTIGGQLICPKSAVTLNRPEPKQHRAWQVLQATLVSVASDQVHEVSEGAAPPAMRDGPAVRLIKGTRELRRYPCGSGLTVASNVLVNRLEIDEPRFE